MHQAKLFLSAFLLSPSFSYVIKSKNNQPNPPLSKSLVSGSVGRLVCNNKVSELKVSVKSWVCSKTAGRLQFYFLLAGETGRGEGIA